MPPEKPFAKDDRFNLSIVKQIGRGGRELETSFDRPASDKRHGGSIPGISSFPTQEASRPSAQMHKSRTHHRDLTKQITSHGVAFRLGTHSQRRSNQRRAAPSCCGVTPLGLYGGCHWVTTITPGAVGVTQNQPNADPIGRRNSTTQRFEQCVRTLTDQHDTAAWPNRCGSY